MAVGESPWLETFRAAGFATDYRGLIDTRPPDAGRAGRAG